MICQLFKVFFPRLFGAFSPADPGFGSGDLQDDDRPIEELLCSGHPDPGWSPVDGNDATRCLVDKAQDQLMYQGLYPGMTPTYLGSCGSCKAQISDLHRFALTSL